MAIHHQPLKALAPIDWNDIPQHDLATFLNDSFEQAQIAIDSVPSAATPATGVKTAATGRARAKTDSAVIYNPAPVPSAPLRDTAATAELSAQLRKEWKEIKTNPKDNPLGISVYKLAGKDGKGAWFARRSVHVGLSFEQWKTGLQKEFAESMNVQGAPGSGNIRGIGAEKAVEHRHVEDAGHLDVFHLSAQFPGPTAPRDFITLLLTSDFSHRMKADENPLRQYMIVSKPCVHPECPPRQGIIRGQYESVEIIREIPAEVEDDDGAGATRKRSLSSADLPSSDRHKSANLGRAGDDAGGNPSPRAIEWLMITRSDPGGSVPRFLIEKGTPPGIIGDAGKFLDWITELTTAPNDDAEETKHANGGDSPFGEGHITSHHDRVAQKHRPTTSNNTQTQGLTQRPSQAFSQASSQSQNADHSDWTPSSTGLYGIINGALGVAGAVASGLRSQLGIPSSFTSSSQDSLDSNTQGHQDMHDDADRQSDASSLRSFASALEKSITGEKAAPESSSIYSDESKSQRLPSLETKDLQKLLERRQKLDRSYAQFQERMRSMREDAKEKDASSLAKLREKHDKEVAKQEAKYEREIRKLEEKRAQEERKAEARRMKVAERQEKSSLTLELEKARTDRDVAMKEIELLRGQVGELQAQNTMLVVKLGRVAGGGAVEMP
ncbi:hypothetical protein E4U38_006764 [Claviceps purpurea]|nr:hypothetical protein E4U38_006764 [Claviceps purpurea]KAG6167975.1 hypothetical protein E4U11_006251 [Claviceps purpurea]KAG6216924.1 hypothetical protein E4U50_004770 [Claviceps purpurea]KAG6234017.1 hypothetical protein E4U25_006149 [Claviceps purpurea]